MGMYAHVRIVNEIEYGNEIGKNYQVDSFFDDLSNFEELSGETLIEFYNFENTFIEINYSKFIKAYEELSKSHKITKAILEIYNEAFNKESCIKNNIIAIEWF